MKRSVRLLVGIGILAAILSGAEARASKLELALAPGSPATGATVTLDLFIQVGEDIEPYAKGLLEANNPSAKPILGYLGGGLLVTWNPGDAAFQSLTFRSALQVGDDPSLRSLCKDATGLCGDLPAKLAATGHAGIALSFGDLAGFFSVDPKKVGTLVLKDVVNPTYRLSFDNLNLLGTPLAGLFDQDTGGLINLMDGTTVDPLNPPDPAHYQDATIELKDFRLGGGNPLVIDLVYGVVPEPGTLALVGSGLLGFAISRRRTA